MKTRKPTVGEWLAIVWPFGSLVLLAFIPAIGDWNVFFVPLILWSWLLAGLCVLAALLITRSWRAAGLLAILAFLTAFLTPFVSSLGAGVWNRAQFKRSEKVYADVVAHAARLPSEGSIGTVSYRIERRPITRIAFPLPVGVADNWSAVVYDPSDAVATARGWGERPGDYTARSDLRGLWGGELVACTRITGHYFRCDFT